MSGVRRKLGRLALPAIGLALVVALPGGRIEAQTTRRLPFHFRGASLEMMVPATNEGGAAEPARVCILVSPSKACFSPARDTTARLEFGIEPHAELVRIAPGRNGLLFTAGASAGGSGSLTSLALLDFDGQELRNLLPTIVLTNQSQYAFWREPGISPAALLLTADFVWARGETHFAPHRYLVTVYGFREGVGKYGRLERYTTTRKYPGLDDADEISVLGPERPVILARLKARTRPHQSSSSSSSSSSSL